MWGSGGEGVVDLGVRPTPRRCWSARCAATPASRLGRSANPKALLEHTLRSFTCLTVRNECGVLEGRVWGIWAFGQSQGGAGAYAAQLHLPRRGKCVRGRGAGQVRGVIFGDGSGCMAPVWGQFVKYGRVRGVRGGVGVEDGHGERPPDGEDEGEATMRARERPPCRRGRGNRGDEGEATVGMRERPPWWRGRGHHVAEASTSQGRGNAGAAWAGKGRGEWVCSGELGFGDRGIVGWPVCERFPELRWGGD
eukprot:366574-Chlamydomonas_euryale.AAC.2